MNAKAIDLAERAAEMDTTGKERKKCFVKFLSIEISKLMTDSFKQGHAEGLAQGKKSCKNFMLENGISGAKVVNFLKNNQ